jgi:transposase-like protein
MNADKKALCKHCGSLNTRKYGLYKFTQLFYCNYCKRKFIANNSLYHMQTPVDQISSALNMYFEGMSINAIRRQLEQEHNNVPAKDTVYNWIQKYTQELVIDFKNYQPKVGDVWVSDQTAIKINGIDLWVWDIMDEKTRYLLATTISLKRTTQVARLLLEKALKKADKAPKVLIADKFADYLDRIVRTADRNPTNNWPQSIKINSNIIMTESLHGVLKARTNVMRRLKVCRTISSFTESWLAFYNYLRPHPVLYGRTPAYKAGIEYPLKNWADVCSNNKPLVKY